MHQTQAVRCVSLSAETQTVGFGACLLSKCDNFIHLPLAHPHPPTDRPIGTYIHISTQALTSPKNSKISQRSCLDYTMNSGSASSAGNNEGSAVGNNAILAPSEGIFNDFIFANFDN